MDWLEGPTLEQLIADGQDGRATKLLGEVAQAVSQTPFSLSFRYRRTLPSLKKQLRSCMTQPKWQDPNSNLHRTLALLDHLDKTTEREKMIHGDLIFSNVILTSDGPRLIDPKGRRADPIFELAKSLVQPFDNIAPSDFEKRTVDRASILADTTGTKPLRLIQWATTMFARKVIFGAIKNPDRQALEPQLNSLLNLSEQ